MRLFKFAIVIALFFFSGQGYTEEKTQEKSNPSVTPMDNAHLDQLIKKIDPKMKGKLGFWKFTVQGYALTVITDSKANRMRIISPIAKAETLDKEQLYRLMQANFDSALDARYAVAQEILWSTFIHPLGSLHDADFLSGLGQVINLVGSYGSSYSSGLFNFRGGDSEDLQRKKLIDELIEKGSVI